MSHEPCSLLCHPKITGKLTRADAVFAVHNQPKSRKPLVQAERRVFEYSSSLQRKLWLHMPGVAFPNAILGKICDLIGTTIWTLHNAIRPAQLHHHCLAVFEVCEVDDCVLESL